MPTRYRKVVNGETVLDVSANEPFALAIQVGTQNGQPIYDTVRFPAGWLASASALWLTQQGIETYEWTPEPPAPPTQADLLAYAARKRWAIEQGGKTLPSGYRIKTDTAAQAKLESAHRAFSAGQLTSLDFKLQDPATGADVWVTADATAIADAHAAVVGHVQACYTKEREVGAEVLNATITTFADVDTAFAAIPA